MSADLASFRVEVLLSLQRALWGMVTPALRGVAVQIDYPRIVIRFVYATQVPDAAEISDDVEAYVSADFLPPVSVESTTVVQDVGIPLQLEAGEEWVFLRREPLIELPLPPNVSDE